MARRERFHLPGATYHVMLRGNEGRPIFFSDGDRSRMCLLMQQGVERFGHSIHAFCFMSNHIHLAIQVGDVSISRIMQHLAFRYAQHVNKRQGRIGHLFQGRFKSILVEGQKYLRELLRYIHLNPVRAKVALLPEEYVWSSHRAYMELAEFSWLKKSRFLRFFGEDRSGAIESYNQYVLRGIGVEVDLNFKLGCREGILGDNASIDAIVERVRVPSQRKITLEDLVAEVCNRYQCVTSDLQSSERSLKESEARALLALLVREIDGLSFESLGSYLRRDASGLSKLASRFAEKCLRSKTAADQLLGMRQWLN